MLTVCTVLKSGGLYIPGHVTALREQVERHLPGASFVALTDQYVPGTKTVRLRRSSWIGWWAKMELFSPELCGNILYFDLDTVIRGSLSEIASIGKLTVLRDFYRPDTGIGSGVMYIPEADRAEVWEAWNKNVFRTMSDLRMKGLGDQAFLQTLWFEKAARFQDLVPGQIVSYKCHVNPQWKARGKSSIPADARVICGHGRPRVPFGLPVDDPVRALSGL